MSNAFPPNAWPASAPEAASPAEQAAEALRGWLDAGERVAVLLAPRGPARLEALGRLERSLADRFVAERWSRDGEGDADANTVQELRGRRSLVIVSDGETLGAEGARALRASLDDDPGGARCAVVALAADEAGAVLAGLGSGLEVVVLRDPRKAGGPPPLGAWRAAAAVVLAAASLALIAIVVLPRFGEAPHPAAQTEPDATAEPLPDVAAMPPPSPPAPEVAAAPPAAPVAAPARAPAPEPPTPERVVPRAAPARRAETPARPKPPPSRVAEAPPARRTAHGWLVVNAIPRAEIHVDGAAIGHTPIVRHRLPPGSHRVTARFGDGKADERTVEVAGSEHYLMFDGR